MSNLSVEEQEQILEQLEKVRQSGRINMCDAIGVQRIAYEMDLYQLVVFIEENRESYSTLILTGKFE